MAKVTLTDIESGYQLKEAYNANNDLLAAAIENTLSRDGTVPNQMEAQLDMNSNKVINVADGTASLDAVNVRQLAATVFSNLDVGSVSVVHTYAALSAIPTPTDGDVAIVDGDGIAGLFVYDSTLSATDNGGTIIDGWVRRFVGPVYVTWFGASPAALASVNDAAFVAALAGYDHVHVPRSGDGIYDITSPITLSRWGQRLTGDSTGNGLGTDAGVVLNVVTGFPIVGGSVAQSVIVGENRYQTIEYITIDCNSIAMHGFIANGGNDSTHGGLRYVNVISSTDDAYVFEDNAWLFGLEMCRATSPAGYGFACNGVSGITTLLFDRCYVSGATSTGGFLFNNVVSFTMNSCAVDASPGFAITLGEGSHGVANAFHTEQTARLISMNPSIVTGIRPRLIINGGRLTFYGNNSSPPATIVENGGSLTVRAVHLSTTYSFTAFMSAAANSKTYWQGNTIDLFGTTSTLDANAYVEGDNKIKTSGASNEQENYTIVGESPQINLREPSGAADNKMTQMRREAGIFQIRDINDSYANTATLFRAKRDGRDTLIAMDGPYATDAAAAAVGISVGRLYYDASGFVKRRLV